MNWSKTALSIVQRHCMNMAEINAFIAQEVKGPYQLLLCHRASLFRL
jgi:hypothetical protein